MKKIKRRFLLSLILACALFQVAWAESKVSMTFDKNQYTINYSIETTCSPKLTMEILYDFSHLVKVLPQSAKVTLLEQGDQWYIVQYDYNYILFKCRFVYKTVIIPEENAINFEMVSYWGNSDFIPSPVKAYGRHTIIPGPKYTTILSTQTCIFEKPVNSLKQTVIKYESGTAIAKIEKYLHKMETER